MKQNTKKNYGKHFIMVTTMAFVLLFSVAAYAAGKTSLPTPTDPDKLTITTVNHYGTAVKDVVTVKSNTDTLASGDKVFVYSSATTSSAVALGNAVANSSGVATVNLNDVGSAGKDIYVSVKKADTTTNTYFESAVGSKITIAPEKVTANITTGVTIANHVDSADKITVTGLAEKDVVKVYSTNNKTKADPKDGTKTVSSQIGTATVGTGKTSVDITISQIGSAGDVYITNTNTDSAESTPQHFATAEAVSKTITTAQAVNVIKSGNEIQIANNVDSTDTVKVVGLSEGDTVKVYTTASGTKPNPNDATKTVSSQIGMGKTTKTTPSAITVSIPGKLPTNGVIYVTVKSVDKEESAPAAPDAVTETQTTIGSGFAPVVVMNTGAKVKDVVIVSDTAFAEKDTLIVSTKLNNGAISTAKDDVIGTGKILKGQKYIVITLNTKLDGNSDIYIAKRSNDMTISAPQKLDKTNFVK